MKNMTYNEEREQLLVALCELKAKTRDISDQYRDTCLTSFAPKYSMYPCLKTLVASQRFFAVTYRIVHSVCLSAFLLSTAWTP